MLVLLPTCSGSAGASQCLAHHVRLATVTPPCCGLRSVEKCPVEARWQQPTMVQRRLQPPSARWPARRGAGCTPTQRPHLSQLALLQVRRAGAATCLPSWCSRIYAGWAHRAVQGHHQRRAAERSTRAAADQSAGGACQTEQRWPPTNSGGRAVLGSQR